MKSKHLLLIALLLFGLASAAHLIWKGVKTSESEATTQPAAQPAATTQPATAPVAATQPTSTPAR